MSSNQFLGSLALLVADYDEAIKFFTEKLNFIVVCDETLSATKRWVLVRPPNSDPNATNCSLLLAKADGELQKTFVGNQSGGRVFLFLHTDDFWRDYEKYSKNGVQFVGEPRVEPYGTVAVFVDLYGNQWDLIQRNKEE